MPLVAKGFRPFFLMAAVFAAAIVPLWLLVLTGRLTPLGPLSGIVWHGHEMLYGFTAAVLAGFLLTAVGNWTARETAVGPWLGALALLWMAGRVAMLAVPGWAGSVIDLAFLPALAFAVTRPLALTLQPRPAPMVAPRAPGAPVPLPGGRNIFVHHIAFPVTLGFLWCANLAVHLDANGVVPGIAVQANRLAVHVVVVIILIVTGRIVPAFTRNATGVAAIRNHRVLDLVAIVATAVVAVLQVSPSRWLPLAAAVAAVAVAGRTWHWGLRHTLRDPLLWVLHAGHGWVAVGLALEALGPFVPVAPSVALHALTAGAIGMLTLGMMARVALGHTGRPLRVPRPVGVAFAVLLATAALRVLGPFWAPEHALVWLSSAAIGWAGAFATYAAVYAPILVSPRVDGRPG